MESKDLVYDIIDFFVLKYFLFIMIYDVGKFYELVWILLGEKENILFFFDENGIFGDFKNSVNCYLVLNKIKSML